MRQEIINALATPHLVSEWRAGVAGGLRVADPILVRLYRGVDRSDPSGCWVVTSQPGTRYPIISIAGVNVGRSRVVFYLDHGREPAGGIVRHTCDNPSCINGRHLIEGTAADNTADMIQRGRAAFNSKRSHCKEGHRLVDPNLYYRTRNGKVHRSCRECARRRNREHAKRKANG